MRKTKKSQAALEFLTTYGWAFIMILATIGALAYFGIIDVTSMLPDRCLFGVDFECKDYRLAIDTVNNQHRADFMIVNSLGETIMVTGATCTFPNGRQELVTNSSGLLPNPWASGTTQTLYCRAWDKGDGVLGGLVKKQKQKVRISFTYQHGSQGFPHLVEGEIFSTVLVIP